MNVPAGDKKKKGDVDVLILSSLYDFSTDLVCEELSHSDVNYLRINRETLPDSRISLNPEEGSARYEYEGIRWHIPPTVRSVWYRQPVFLRNTPGIAMSVEEQLSRSQWAAFIRGLTIFDGADWVNHPQATYQAESKPYQLRYAAKLGFQIPATLITNDSAAVSCRQVGDPFVIKSVDTVLLRDGDDEVFAYSSIVSCSEIVDEEFYEVPSTCQQLLQPKLDLRITIIGDDFYCISITNEGRQIDGDWRLTAKDKLTYREHSLPEEDKKRCVDLVKGLGLRFGAIDLALTPSGLFFIEINPTGEWGWLNGALRPIASNIAHFLAKPRSTVT